MRVAINHHQTKALPLAQALVDHGHELVANNADAFLIDLDIPAYRERIDVQVDAGAKAFLYPHSAGYELQHDLYEPYPRVSGQFVNGEGAVELARRLDYPGDVYQTGWYFCPILPFRAAGRPRSVLFAPLHPLVDSAYLAPFYQDQNREIFAALLEVPDIEITVRHIHSIEANGLWEVPGVRYTPGEADNSFDQIDAADVVVALQGTFPWMAVARGCPTVMAGGYTQASDREHDGTNFARRWDDYKDYIRYPIDAADGDMADLIRFAAASDDPVRAWKDRFLGREWDPTAFVRALERAVDGPAGAEPLDARSFVSAARISEVVRDPRLLAAYCQTFRESDDATLVLYSPGLDAGKAVVQVQEAVRGAGLREEDLPDVLIETSGAPAAEEALAARVQAFVGQDPPAALGGAVAFDRDELPALRARAEAVWSALVEPPRA